MKEIKFIKLILLVLMFIPPAVSTFLDVNVLNQSLGLDQSSDSSKSHMDGGLMSYEEAFDTKYRSSLKCLYCKKKFGANIIILSKHIKYRHSKNCCYCKQKFDSKGEILKHMFEEHKNEPGFKTELDKKNGSIACSRFKEFITLGIEYELVKKRK